ncbi:MAG: sigma-70 family RNA polymerase sigma factor [Bacteroidales bacterium]|nr:sigma-70 family RNA polymerase sigma factor [Bacteroidales bacterium]
MEKTLVRKIKEGDSRSFRLLYDKYVSDLYTFIYRYIKSADITDEIVQDTFIRFWMYRARLDENRSVKSYLFTISYRQMLKEMKRQMKNPLMRDYVEFSESLSIDHRQAYDYDIYVKTIEIAKESLSPRQREIWQMSREDGLSSMEIAEMLSIKEQVVRNQLSAAQRKIKEYLMKYL